MPMYFLIDFENVKSSGLRGTDYLEEADFLTIFYSDAVHNCERRYLHEIEKSGCEFDICKLKRVGKNGLDFYIASRIGEFYGTGHKEQIAIVSKDTGFNAVCDYWSIRLPENKKVIVAPSIERAMIASDERSNRVKTLKSETAGANIGVYEARYRERRKLRELLKELFGESEYANQIPEIQEMLKTEKTLKATYLGSLHRFGRKQGTVIYSKIKPLLEHEIA